MARKLSERVSAGPALASDSSTGPRSLSSLTRCVLGLVDRVGGQRAEFAELVERRRTRLSRWSLSTVSASGMVVQRLVDHRLLVGELADQVVEAVGGGDDVAGLVVDVADELVELLNQAAQVVLAAGERGAERLR